MPTYLLTYLLATMAEHIMAYTICFDLKVKSSYKNVRKAICLNKALQFDEHHCSTRKVSFYKPNFVKKRKLGTFRLDNILLKNFKISRRFCESKIN